MRNILISALVAAVVAWLVMAMVGTDGSPAAQRESVAKRVMRTGVIRCGYVVWPPQLLVDANSGEKSGFAYDFMNALAKELDVKVEWTEEVGWGNFGEGLETGRYDLMCAPVWQSGARAKAALLTRPIAYEAMQVWKLEGDRRFAKVADLNAADVRTAVIDGDITQAVRRAVFPKAQEVALAASVDPAQLLMSVPLKKADVVFSGLIPVSDYNANNPTAKLVAVDAQTPVRLFGEVLAVRKDAHDFKAMLDSTIAAMYLDGSAARIVAPYQPGLLPADR